MLRWRSTRLVFNPEVFNLHVQMIFWINRWFTYQIMAKSRKMRQIHFNKCRFWATGRKHQEVLGGGGRSNSAPSQITQRRVLWWFRFFDTWRPLIRPLLVAEGGDKAGGCGWMLARMKKLCSFPLYCTFVTLTHIDLHYKEARWAICLPPRSLSPRLCVLWVYLCFLGSDTVKKKTSSRSEEKKECILLTMQHLREVLTYKSFTVDPEVHYWSEMTFDTMSYRGGAWNMKVIRTFYKAPWLANK